MEGRFLGFDEFIRRTPYETFCSICVVLSMLHPAVLGSLFDPYFHLCLFSGLPVLTYITPLPWYLHFEHKNKYENANKCSPSVAIYVHWQLDRNFFWAVGSITFVILLPIGEAVFHLWAQLAQIPEIWLSVYYTFKKSLPSKGEGINIKTVMGTLSTAWGM